MEYISAPLRTWIDNLAEQAPSIAVASVFTTQDPVSELFEMRDYVHSLPAPSVRELDSLGVQRGIVNYEIFVGRYNAPRFQEGEIPYKTEGGGIVFDEEGKPVIQGEEDLRFSLSVPEGDMPEGRVAYRLICTWYRWKLIKLLSPRSGFKPCQKRDCGDLDRSNPSWRTRCWLV